MSHEEYLNQIERKIARLNKIIDKKILMGQKYKEEAKNHKILVQTMWKHQLYTRTVSKGQRSFLGRILASA